MEGHEMTQTALSSLRELAPNSFIFEKRDAIPGFLCDNMVARFEQNLADQYAGRIGQDMGSNQQVSVPFKFLVPAISFTGTAGQTPTVFIYQYTNQYRKDNSVYCGHH